MASENNQEQAHTRQKALVKLLLEHQRSIFAYIYSLVPNKSDADDILQETCLTIHEKFDDFQLGTNFLLWANRIAYWKVRELRQKFARSKVVFSDEVFELVSQTAESLHKEDTFRHEALSGCLKKLKPRDRQMILARYEDDGGVEAAASISNRTVTATYKALNRIRQSLHECVNKQALLERSMIS
ncbi:MAG: sigma-70 family RNA polymerase sigma factor [Opitutales bacterium]